MSLIDQIDRYICELLAEQASVELSRNELARRFGCSPAQINYVIARRFAEGYSVETRRGSGGYVRILRLDRDLAMEPGGIEQGVATLHHSGYLSDREALLLLGVLDLIEDRKALANRLSEILNHPLFR